MILIETKGVPPLMEVTVHILGEHPAAALSMLQDAYRNCIDIFLQTHEKGCKHGAECTAAKTAANMKYHLAQMDEETRTIIATSKHHDNP
jgi:hypothetical protein